MEERFSGKTDAPFGSSLAARTRMTLASISLNGNRSTPRVKPTARQFRGSNLSLCRRSKFGRWIRLTEKQKWRPSKDFFRVSASLSTVAKASSRDASVRIRPACARNLFSFLQIKSVSLAVTDAPTDVFPSTWGEQSVLKSSRCDKVYSMAENFLRGTSKFLKQRIESLVRPFRTHLFTQVLLFLEKHLVTLALAPQILLQHVDMRSDPQLIIALWQKQYSLRG